MKRLKKLITGTLVILIITMLMQTGMSFLEHSSDAFNIPPAYAQEGGEEESEGEGSEPPEWLEEEAEAEGWDEEIEGDGTEGMEEGYINYCPENDFNCIVDFLPETQQEHPQTVRNSEKLLEEVSYEATKVHRIFAPLINFFAFKIGDLLGHDYLYQDAMGKMLHSIWVVSRNIVNIAFVFLLLWIALMTIFDVSKTDFGDLKMNLIKFALLLIAVNFSWLGTKIVLDAASVVTHVTFAIPSGVGGAASMMSGSALDLKQCEVDTLGEEPLHGDCSPTVIFAPVDAGANNIYYWEDTEGEEDNCARVRSAYMGSTDSAYNQDGSLNEDASEENKKFQGRTSICMENLNLFSYEQNTATIFLTYGTARIQNLVRATANDPMGLAVGVVLSLIIQIAYTLALGALFLALVVRMLVLWIFVGFSPLLVLAAYFKGMEGQEEGDFKFGINEFLNWAFVPAKVGVIFAISFVMISAGQSMGDTVVSLLNTANSKSGIVVKVLNMKTLFMGMDSLQQFIWLIMSLAVLWLGVFAVLGKMSIIGGIAQKVSTWTKDKASLIATSPYYLPILPLGGDQWTSAKSTFENLDFTKKLEEYKYGGKEEVAGVRELNTNARKLERNNLERFLSTGDARYGKQIARTLGAGSVDDLLSTHSDERIIKAIVSSGHASEEEAKKIVKTLHDVSRIKAGTPPRRAEPKPPEGAPKPVGTPKAGTPKPTPGATGGGAPGGKPRPAGPSVPPPKVPPPPAGGTTGAPG